MYLTEQKLAYYLQEFYPNTEFILNKSLPNSEIRCRPDVRSEDLKIIVEFDGYKHYTDVDTIFLDYRKDKLWKSLGYKVIRMPYFVQLDKQVLINEFSIETEFVQEYRHGFIDPKATLPSNFCEQGVKRFIKDLKRFDYIKDQLVESLREKIKERGDIELVLPSTLSFLVL